MKPNIWIFAIEPLESRYTAQWLSHVPKLLEEKLGDGFYVETVLGVQQDTQVTDGAFLNFSDTNYWKSSQLCNFLTAYNQGLTTGVDHFLFADAWNPVVIQLKYMSDLLGYHWKFHGLWHAGSYDPEDFLGRYVGNEPWVRFAEKSMYWSYDHNYFATDFHKNLFSEELLGGLRNASMLTTKSVKTGWPMEYLPDVLAPYKNTPKRDLIVFPHRIAPEKQVDIFRALAKRMPEYEFVVCQDSKLSKHEYHTLLAQAKIVFSANLQETLGISCYEGALVGAIPLVPDRLSYSEMYDAPYKYPSAWTLDHCSFLQNAQLLRDRIKDVMDNYEAYVGNLNTLVRRLGDDFFSAQNLLKNFR